MANPWKWIVDKVTPPPKWAKGPYKTSATHALVTVLGLMPYPIGLAGIAVFSLWSHSWLWLAASSWTCGWYWVREYRQTGLRPKGPYMTTWDPAPEVVERSFGQRYDTWMDVLFPTIALGLMYGFLG